MTIGSRIRILVAGHRDITRSKDLNMISNNSILNISHSIRSCHRTSGYQGDGEMGERPDRERGYRPLPAACRVMFRTDAAIGELPQSGAQQETVHAFPCRTKTGMPGFDAMRGMAEKFRTAGGCGHQYCSPHGNGDTALAAGRAEGGCVTGSGPASRDDCSVPVSPNGPGGVPRG